MTDDERRCAISGEPAQRDHHLTGRGADGTQLDDELTVPLSHDGHELVHEDLRNQAIDKPLLADSVPEQIERRLRRVGLFFGRVAESAPPFSWMLLLAREFVRWADELGGWVNRLDTKFPQWRLA
jgi:hypothetical protein